MRLTLENITGGYGSRIVVQQVSCCFEPGEVVCLLGANGCGKTTLFKMILQLLRPVSGTIRAGVEDMRGWPQRRLARTLAYVPQSHHAPFAFSVRDVVLMSRAAHLAPFSSPGRSDRDAAEQALDSLGILDLADARYTEISGGERQLVLIARALAQQTQWLVLDEPASSLDLSNQVKVLRAVRNLAKAGLGVLMTTHVPDHAFTCASRVAVMSKGRIVAMDVPERAMTAATLEGAYGIPLRVIDVGSGARMVAAL
jgi:iron complex transport system ATP-binding protein